VPVVVTSAPRPDEESGHERKMPYTVDGHDETWLGTRLWAALCRVLTGEEPSTAQPMETQEPPVGGEEQAEPPKPRCCGRCSVRRSTTIIASNAAPTRGAPDSVSPRSPAGYQARGRVFEPAG